MTSGKYFTFQSLDFETNEDVDGFVSILSNHYSKTKGNLFINGEDLQLIIDNKKSIK